MNKLTVNKKMLKIMILRMKKFFIVLLSITYSNLSAQDTVTANTANQLRDFIGDEDVSRILIPRESNFNFTTNLVINRALTIEASGPGNSLPTLTMTNGSSRLFNVTADNVTFMNLDLRGVDASTNNSHVGIQAENRRNLTVRNCRLSNFVQCISSSGRIGGVGGWNIVRNQFSNFHRRGVGINRSNRGRDDSSFQGAVRFINNTFTIGNTVAQHPRNRAISIDGGNTGVSILNLRNTLLRRNTFTNCGIALSRVRNVSVSGTRLQNGNQFIANRLLLDEPIHIEELCDNVTISYNTITFNDDLNASRVMIDLNGSTNVNIDNNVASGLTEHFFGASRYNSSINVTNNDLRDVRLPRSENEVIHIVGCGANDVNINNNRFAPGHVARANRGTFQWDLLENNSPQLGLFFGPSFNNNPTLVRNFANFYRNDAQTIEFLSENFYYRCTSNNDNCGTVRAGSPVRGNNRIVSSIIGECGTARNFFGNPTTNTNLSAFGRMNPPLTGREARFRNASKALIGPEENNSISIYPNPLNSERILTVTGQFNNGAVLHIHDLSGKAVFVQNLNSSNATVNLSSLNSGLFLVEIEVTGDIVYTGKLLIQ